MFIRVTTVNGNPRLINVDHIYCIAKNKEWSEIIYTDDTTLTVTGCGSELKGADDE